MKDKSMKQENQERTHIFSGSTFEELAGYSRAVVVGDHIYVSGTVGINFQTGKLPAGSFPVWKLMPTVPET